MAQAVSFKAAEFLASTVNQTTGVVTNYNWDGKTSASGVGGVAYITDGMCQANILGSRSIAPAMQAMALGVARKITDTAWGTDGRSPRAATLLQWYLRHTDKPESGVQAALQKFIGFVTSERARYSPATGSCATSKDGGFCLLNNTITTGMVGLVVADLLQFNSTFAWGEPPPCSKTV